MNHFTWHILMVDDDEEDHYMVREMLSLARQRSFELEWMPSYARGREALNRQSYDAILVDYDLAGYTGIEFIEEARRAGIQAPILLLTGRGNYEVDVEAMQAGAADYLSKRELSPALLERAIRFAIERKRSEREREILLEENRRQRDLLERIMANSLTGIAVLQGANHCYILTNPTYDAIAHKGSLIGRTVAETWPEVASEIVPLLDKVYRTGEAFQATDYPLQLVQNGKLETRHFTFAYAPFYDHAGQVEGIVVTAEETTQQVAARHALLEWEGILRSFFESEAIFAGIMELHEDDLCYVRTNQKLAAFFGRTPEQMAGKFASELGIDAESRAYWVQKYRHCYETGQAFTMEYPFQVHGKGGWYLGTISLIDSVAGDRPRFAYVVVDVTERKLWEQRLTTALEEAENEKNRLQAILEVLPVGISIQDQHGGVVQANQQIEQVWGDIIHATRSLKDYGLYSARWIETGQKLQPEEWASAQAIRTGKTVLGQYVRIERSNGSHAYIINNAAPIRNAQGAITGSVVATMDITQRMEAEAALRENDKLLKETAERFQTLADHISQLTWMMDPDGWVFWYNQRWFDYTGATLDEMQGVGWQKVLHPDHVERVVASQRRCLESGQTWEESFPLRGKDGQYRWFLTQAVPIRDEAGQITRWFGTNTDITERERREQNAHFLASLGNQLISPKDPDTVIQLVCEKIAQYLNADICVLSEEDGQAHEMVIHSGYRNQVNTYQARLPIEIFSEPLITAIRAGEKIIIEDAIHHPWTCSHNPAVFRPGSLASFVILPRMVDGKCIGALSIASEQPRPWLPDELDLFESSANLAWLALEQARIQQNLQIAETRFRITLSSVPLFVFTMDHDLRYTWVHNPQFGFTMEGMVGKRDVDLFPPEPAARYTELKRTVLETGRGIQMELKDNYLDENLYFFVTFEPILDANGSVTGLAGATLNITQQRRLETIQAEYVTQMEVQQRLLEQREMERMDIARDLHDGVLQDLAAISFGIAEALTIDHKQERVERLKTIQQAILNQSHEIRVFCNELRPPALAPFGLERAILSHIDDFKHRHPHLQIHHFLTPDHQTLPENLRMALFRIYQEVMNNVVKHSKASDVWVTLSLDPDEVILEIEDNGLGFSVPTDWVVQARSGHLGLIGMRERAKAAGAKIEFDSKPGHGARVRVTVPR